MGLRAGLPIHPGFHPSRLPVNLAGFGLPGDCWDYKFRLPGFRERPAVEVEEHSGQQPADQDHGAAREDRMDCSDRYMLADHPCQFAMAGTPRQDSVEEVGRQGQPLEVAAAAVHSDLRMDYPDRCRKFASWPRLMEVRPSANPSAAAAPSSLDLR